MALQMTSERMEAYVEVIEILKHMDKKYVEKVPQKLKDFFENNCSKEYKFNLNLDKPLAEQNLKSKTLAILGMLNVNYWCENEEAKQKLLAQYYEEERLYQEELREKYNPDNIFKNRNQEKSIEENIVKEEVALVEYKESIFRKVINKIKKIFHIS